MTPLDLAQIDALVAKLKNAAATAGNNGHKEACHHYLRLAHQADHAGRLLRAVQDGINAPPAGGARIAADVEAEAKRARIAADPERERAREVFQRALERGKAARR